MFWKCFNLSFLSLLGVRGEHHMNRLNRGPSWILLFDQTSTLGGIESLLRALVAKVKSYCLRFRSILTRLWGEHTRQGVTGDQNLLQSPNVSNKISNGSLLMHGIINSFGSPLMHAFKGKETGMLVEKKDFSERKNMFPLAGLTSTMKICLNFLLKRERRFASNVRTWRRFRRLKTWIQRQLCWTMQPPKCNFRNQCWIWL